eukprot:TRINITY_DN710_c0_g1_i1.p1 TRINITY_DN710_c0_g1~~TRINITY_DN710_c0_g1_i1.p1  ORF type:complete len:210 (+),score=39.10 TRINITY_DN710_c0_g1_i1:114-743(+)
MPNRIVNFVISNKITIFSLLAFTGYSAYSDYRILSDTDFNSNSSSGLIEKIKIDTGINVEKSNDGNLRVKRRQSVDNIISLINKGSYEEVFIESELIAKYHVEEQSNCTDFFLVLPNLYMKKKKEIEEINSNLEEPEKKIKNPEKQSVAHYDKYTKDLCRSYLIRNFHGWTYLKLVFQDQLISYLLIGLLGTAGKYLKNFQKKNSNGSV